MLHRTITGLLALLLPTLVGCTGGEPLPDGSAVHAGVGDETDDDEDEDSDEDEDADDDDAPADDDDSADDDDDDGGSTTGDEPPEPPPAGSSSGQPPMPPDDPPDPTTGSPQPPEDPDPSGGTSGSDPGPQGCDATEFTCQDGACIPAAWRCDGESDCDDNSDEAGCSNNTSTTGSGGGDFCNGADEWLCTNGTECISLAYRCDGVAGDCTDGSDELGC